MKKLLFILIGAVLGVYLGVTSAAALNSLQLDIVGGTYSPPGTPDTIVANENPFTLRAYLIPGTGNLLTDNYYISMALVPQVGPDPSNLGSFIFAGTTINVTEDMAYGVPPLEQILPFDPHDLSQHGIYETYFYQWGFTFGSDEIDPYNTQDRAKAGDPIGTTGTGMYYEEFSVDVTNLSTSYLVHFDLYNTKLTEGTDIDVNQNAPFSHDAESGYGGGGGDGGKVPEPATMILLGSGLVGLAGYMRKRMKK